MTSKYKLLILFFVISNLIYCQNNETTRIDEAFESLNEDRYNEALIKFNKILLKNSNCYDCYFGRAKAKYGIKDYSGALLDINKALNSNEDIQHSYKLKGDILYRLNKFQDAINSYKKAKEIQKKIDSIRNDGSRMDLQIKFELVSKLKIAYLNSKKPQLGNFSINLNYLEKIISYKLSANDFYCLINDQYNNWDEKYFMELNPVTNKHDLKVYSAYVNLDYKGSPIAITIESIASDTTPIRSVKVDFHCKCDWFNIKNETKQLGYSLEEYTDKADDYFGGIDSKYKKGKFQILYNKFHSKLYSNVLITTRDF